MGPKEQRTPWRWAEAEARVVLEISADVVERLHGEAMRGYSLIPRRGAEIGGILLGTVLPGGPESIVVADFEEVRCDYTEGPTYVLKGLDRNRFRQRLLELARPSASDLQPVGYFRSQTGDDIELTGADVMLMDEFLPGPSAVVLLIKPSAFSGSTAQVFVRENGHFETKPISEPLPFQARGAPGNLTADRPRPDRTHSKPEPEPGSEPYYETKPIPGTLAEVRERPQGRGFPRLLAWACLIAALVIFGGAMSYHAKRQSANPTAATPTDPYALGLRAERVHEGILLNWSRTAPALRAASRGTLTITEGTDSRTVTLDLPQVRKGALLYRHVTPEVRFRFEMFFAEGRSLVETVVWRQTAPLGVPAG